MQQHPRFQCMQVVVRVRPALQREINAGFQNTVAVDPAKQTITLSEDLSSLARGASQETHMVRSTGCGPWTGPAVSCFLLQRWLETVAHEHPGSPFKEAAPGVLAAPVSMLCRPPHRYNVVLPCHSFSLAVQHAPR